MVKKLLVVIAIAISLSCSQKNVEPVKIAINPWPGYEFLFLAEKKGFFSTVGLDIKLIQLGSLADAQRAYVNGSADGLASTLIEAVQAEVKGRKPLKVVLVPDYSDGGDVIVSRKEVTEMKGLKGKTIGCEVTSLGIFILERALAKSGLSLKDVNIVNTEQMRGVKAMNNNDIDAFVSYPPVSIELLKNEDYHKVFSSAEIPNEIIDTISISVEVLNRNPHFVEKLQKAWQMSLDYYASNTAEAVKIMSTREGISEEDFVGTLSDLKILDYEDQIRLFKTPEKLQESVISVCETLVHMNSIQADCEHFPNIIYGGK